VDVIGDTGALVARARALAEQGQRRILGLVGPPGGGKSTAARIIADALGPLAVLVPMDGFHLCQAELVRLGRRDRMGAPDTFDAAGYAALLRRLRDPVERVVYAPEFRREFEEPFAGAIAVPASVPLVLTEGNYLLVAEGDWGEVRPLLDAAWYVETDEQERIERLVARHIRFGKSPDDARAWTLETDQRNADLVAATKARADAVVELRHTTAGAPS
jgi:pantothenate kinase